MSIRKSIRFEIFKRDQFQCQYCGRKPPIVVLEIDHIIPVSKGGDDLQENLITACEECNRGKAARPLDRIPSSLVEQMSQKAERMEQVEAYNAFLTEIRERQIEQIERIGTYWFNKFKKKKNRFVFGDQRIPTIRTFLSRLPEAEILDAIDVAHSRLPVGSVADHRTFKYFCGICWKKIKRSDNGPDSTN